MTSKRQGLGKGPDAEQEAAVKACLKAGMAGLKTDKLDDAIQALRDGLEKDPRSDYYLGKAYERKKRTEDAIEHSRAGDRDEPRV